MPKTEPRPKPFPEMDDEGKGNSNGYKRPTFIRCDLSADQKRELAEWANTRNADDLIDYINESCEEDYILSVKKADAGYQASLTKMGQVVIHNANAGKSLVTRASKPERALWSLYYKHREIMVKDWSKGNTEAELEW